MPQSTYRRRRVVRRQREALILVLAAAVVVVGAIRYGHGGGSTPPTNHPTTTTLAPARAPYGVGFVTMTLKEPATASLPARTVTTDVRYPTSGPPTVAPIYGARPLSANGPYPLILFSQGFDISPEAYYRLLNAWTSAGFVVADPAYPLTSPGAPGGVVRTDIIHHPGDLSFVLTSLIRDNVTAGNTLYGLINPHEVGAAGQSDGGDVTLAAADNSCCHDGRIKAAVILSGAELSWFPGTYFTSPGPPLFVLQGTRDFTMNPIECSVELYNQASAPKYYLALIGQTHLSAYVPPGPALTLVERTTTDFFRAYLRHSPNALRALSAIANNSPLARLTHDTPVAPAPGGCAGAPSS